VQGWFMILFGVCWFNESFCHFAHYLRVNKLQIKNFLLCLSALCSLYFLPFHACLRVNRKHPFPLERYNAHEQDLLPRVKRATPTNEILSRIRTSILVAFRSNIYFGKFCFRSSSRAAGYFSPRRLDDSSWSLEH